MNAAVCEQLSFSSSLLLSAREWWGSVAREAPPSSLLLKVAGRPTVRPSVVRCAPSRAKGLKESRSEGREGWEGEVLWPLSFQDSFFFSVYLSVARCLFLLPLMGSCLFFLSGRRKKEGQRDRVLLVVVCCSALSQGRARGEGGLLNRAVGSPKTREEIGRALFVRVGWGPEGFRRSLFFF